MSANCARFTSDRSILRPWVLPGERFALGIWFQRHTRPEQYIGFSRCFGKRHFRVMLCGATFSVGNSSENHLFWRKTRISSGVQKRIRSRVARLREFPRRGSPNSGKSGYVFRFIDRDTCKPVPARFPPKLAVPGLPSGSCRGKDNVLVACAGLQWAARFAGNGRSRAAATFFARLMVRPEGTRIG